MSTTIFLLTSIKNPVNSVQHYKSQQQEHLLISTRLIDTLHSGNKVNTFGRDRTIFLREIARLQDAIDFRKGRITDKYQYVPGDAPYETLIVQVAFSGNITKEICLQILREGRLSWFCNSVNPYDHRDALRGDVDINDNFDEVFDKIIDTFHPVEFVQDTFVLTSRASTICKRFRSNKTERYSFERSLAASVICEVEATCDAILNRFPGATYPVNHKSGENADGWTIAFTDNGETHHIRIEKTYVIPERDKGKQVFVHSNAFGIYTNRHFTLDEFKVFMVDFRLKIANVEVGNEKLKKTLLTQVARVEVELNRLKRMISDLK